MTDEFSSVLREFSKGYDIDLALDEFAQRIEDEAKAQDGSNLDIDEVTFEHDDDMSILKMSISFNVKCVIEPYYPGSRWDPPSGGGFEDYEPDLDIESLKKMFNEVGLGISISISDKIAQNNSCIRDAMKSNEDFRDFFNEYLTERFYSRELDDIRSHHADVIAGVIFDVDLVDFAAFGKFLLPYQAKNNKEDNMKATNETKAKIEEKLSTLKKILESFESLDGIREFKDDVREDTDSYVSFTNDKDYVINIFMNRLHSSSGKMVRIEGYCNLNGNEYSVYVTTRASSFKEAFDNVISELRGSKAGSEGIKVQSVVVGDNLALDPAEADGEGSFGASFKPMSLLKLASISPKEKGNEWSLNCDEGGVRFA